MGYQDYISESEATNLAGVSANTLQRFVEAGYLQTEADGDGVKLFSKSELWKVFGLITDSASMYSSPARTSPETEKPAAEASLAESVTSEVTAPISSNEDFSVTSDEISEPGFEREISDRSKDSIEASPVEKVVEVATIADEPKPAPIESTATKSPSESTLQSDYQKLLEMQEKLLTERETEITRLLDERNWLRERVEKLEEKSDRDQLLLLAKSQTIKSLADSITGRKSTFRLALEWLGFLPMEGQDARRVQISDKITERVQPEGTVEMNQGKTN